MEQNTIALQLYTVRDFLKADFEQTIRTLDGWGIRAAETAGEFGGNVRTAKTLFDSLGWSIPSAHAPLPLGDKQQEVLDMVGTLGCDYVICPWFDPQTYFQSLDGIKQACDLLNEANRVVKEAGYTFGYHNHWFEMATVEGKPAYQHMLDLLDEDIVFELDVYWVTVGGLDPLLVMEELRGRLPLIHIKDGAAVRIEDSMQALGTGAMNIPSVLESSAALWHIIELDRCETDMMEAVQQSFDYLKRLDR